MSFASGFNDFGRDWARWSGMAFRWVAGMEQKKKPSSGHVPKIDRPSPGRRVPVTEWDPDEDEEPEAEPDDDMGDAE